MQKKKEKEKKKKKKIMKPFFTLLYVLESEQYILWLENAIYSFHLQNP